MSREEMKNRISQFIEVLDKIERAFHFDQHENIRSLTVYPLIISYQWFPETLPLVTTYIHDNILGLCSKPDPKATVECIYSHLISYMRNIEEQIPDVYNGDKIPFIIMTLIELIIRSFKDDKLLYNELRKMPKEIWGSFFDQYWQKGQSRLNKFHE